MIGFVVGRLEQGVISDPTSCEIDISGCPLEDLGGGYRGYCVELPYPGVMSCVIDARTGAIFSGSLGRAREEIRKTELQDSAQRIKTGLNLREQSTQVPPNVFWPWVIQLLESRK